MLRNSNIDSPQRNHRLHKSKCGHKVALIALLRPLQYFQPELAYIQAPIITDPNLRRTLSVRITSQSMATLYRLPLIDPSLLVQSNSERNPTGSTVLTIPHAKREVPPGLKTRNFPRRKRLDLLRDRTN